MNKSTKGALAAAAAGVLLLGGAGTLAYWTDSGEAIGTSIYTGHFDINTDDCDFQSWTLDDGSPWVTPDGNGGYNYGTLVPGDTLTMDCDVIVNIAGNHLTHADFEVVSPTISGGGADQDSVDEELQVSLTVNNGGSADNVPVTDGQAIPVEVQVTWPWGVEDNDLNGADLALNLNNFTITATQEHLDEDNH